MWLLSSALFAWAFLFCSLQGCTTAQHAPAATGSAGEESDYLVKARLVSLARYEKGRLVARVQAQSCDLGKKKVSFTKAEARFTIPLEHARNKGKLVAVFAGRVESSREMEEVNLTDGVVVHVQGMRLSSDRLVFHRKQGRLTTNTRVHISTKSFTAQGKGLDADLDRGKMTIQSDVTTNFTLFDSGRKG